MEVVFAGDAAEVPLGVGGLFDERAEGGVIGLIIVEPILEKFLPLGFRFAVDETSLGAAAVSDGVIVGGLVRVVGHRISRSVCDVGFCGGTGKSR